MNRNCQYCNYSNSEDTKYCALCHHPVQKDTSGKHIPVKFEKQPVQFTPSIYETGKTLVHVFKLDINEQTQKQRIIKIHEGVIVAKTNSFARVYNAAPIEKGGDVSPETTQWFPFQSKRVWMEIVGAKKEKFVTSAVLE